jgi:hypothetical protein
LLLLIIIHLIFLLFILHFVLLHLHLNLFWSS